MNRDGMAKREPQRLLTMHRQIVDCEVTAASKYAYIYKENIRAVAFIVDYVVDSKEGCYGLHCNLLRSLQPLTYSADIPLQR